MLNTSCQSIIKRLIQEDIRAINLTTLRRGREMNESLSVKIKIHHEDLHFFSNFRESEYNQYNEMIKNQIPRFKKYYNLDRYSRRLLIQFPADWYDDKKEDYMPCPESFLVQYIKDDYVIIMNFRSSEIQRVSEDISLIVALCKNELNLSGILIKICVHFMNVHEYIDGGTSEDFKVKEGYYNV